MESYSFPPSGWIWTGRPEVDAGTPKIVYFRKTFNLDADPKTAIARVSADSRYRLYVNGASVAFGPCKGDNQVWYYDEIDLAPYLTAGDNILAAVVLRYSTLNTGNHSVWRTAMPGFYFGGTVNDLSVQADKSWKCHMASHIKVVPENPYMRFLYHMEQASGDARLNGWLRSGYDDSDWEGVTAYHPFMFSKGASPGNLLPRPVPPMFEAERRMKGVVVKRGGDINTALWSSLVTRGEALAIPANSHEIVELDAGELTTGFLHLCFANGAGAQVSILTSEAYGYEPDAPSPLSLPRKGDRTDFVNGRLHGFTDSYRVAGYGSDAQAEEYEPFWFRTFRFVQLDIHTANQPLTILDLHYRETGYPLDAKSTVTTSDSSLSDIWDISLRTLRRCMHETYEDCPFYEQLQYAMDTRSQILYTYSVAADDRMARRCIDDFHRSLRCDGLTNCCYPSMGTNVIPGFSLYYIMMIHDHMMYFGDRALVERYLPTVEAILSFFERNLDSRGLVGKIGGPIGGRFWSFIDWAPEWSATSGVPDAILEGPITMESLLYVYTLTLASELAEYVGRPEQGKRYTAQAERVKAAINRCCLSANGLYQDGPGVEKFSQHCQVWAVLSGTAPENEWERIMRATLGDTGLPKCSVAMAFYLFRAAELAGLYDLTDALWEPWREMLRNHLTTCQENEVDARSDCHAWGSLVLYELPSVVLGIRPAKPGYEAIEVRPNPGYLDWAKGQIITPKGMVTVGWEKTEAGLNLKVEAPAGVTVVIDKRQPSSA